LKADLLPFEAISGPKVNFNFGLFCWDPWMEDVSFKYRFNRLFELSDSKMTMVAEIEHLGWGESGDA